MNEKKKINWDKPLRTTAEGFPVRLICNNLKSNTNHTHVLAVSMPSGEEQLRYSRKDNDSIENVSEKQEAWVNIHGKVFGRTTQSTHPTKAVANAMAGEFRTARVKIEWEEGQFDE